MEEKIIAVEDIFKRVLKHKIKIGLSILIIVSVTVIYSLIMPKSYLSGTSLMPPEDSGGMGLSSYLQDLDGAISLGGGGGSNRANVMAAILKSRTLADKVYNKLNLGENIFFEELEKRDVLDLIAKMIETEVEKSDMIIVRASVSTGYFSSEKEEDEAKELSAKICNAATESLDEILREKSNSSARRSKVYIQQELDKYYSQLDSVARELEKFQKENKVLELEDQTKAIVGQAIEVNSELTKLKTDLNLAKIEFSPNSPQVRTLQKQVDFLKQQSLELQRGNLSADEFSIPLNEVPTLARQYAELFRDREILEKVIKYMETQKHQEAIQEEKDVPIVQVLDEAIAPEKRNSPNRKMMVLVSLLIGTILVVSTSFFLEYRKLKNEVIADNG